MALSGIIQGHDTIPVIIADKFAPLFELHLPGWTRNGFYNFQATASTQLASQQLKTLMHSGLATV
jgi:hypothetical protein